MVFVVEAVPSPTSMACEMSCQSGWGRRQLVMVPSMTR